MSNVIFYWDGASGACRYENKHKFFTKKPTISHGDTTVAYDVITYDSSDGISWKILNGNTVELTASEITVVTESAKEYATESDYNETQEAIKEQLDAHNEDDTAHHDIRVQLSNLHEFAHNVASVWGASELQFESTSAITIPFEYIAHDLTDCTTASSTTMWQSPVSESYDFKVQVGLMGNSSEESLSITVKLLKSTASGSEELGKKTFTLTANPSNGHPLLVLSVSNAVLSKGTKVYATIQSSVAKGAIVPSRTYLVVDNHGSTIATRMCNFLTHTVGNVVNLDESMIVSSVDSTGTPQITADTWNTDTQDN